MAMFTDEEDALIDFLEEKYGCHTLILYGSRALGTNKPDSDWDVLALNRGYEREYLHEQVEGVGEVNAYIFPEEDAIYKPQAPSGIYVPRDYLVRLRHGKVLMEYLDLGTKIVQMAKNTYEAGPAAMPEKLVGQIRYQWLHYWVGLIRQEAVAPEMARFVRHRMVNQCAESYFRLRQQWVPSEKDILPRIQQENPAVYQAIVQAMQPSASADDFTQMAEIILSV